MNITKVLQLLFYKKMCYIMPFGLLLACDEYGE
jgi:hypothetical protein